MTPEEAVATVRSYYDAYRAESPEATAAALGVILDPSFSLESPLVEARFGGPVTGELATAAAAGAAPFLARATVEALYVSLEATGVAALIHFPTPVGVVVQSEHFELDPGTSRITRLRSYYDPRLLLLGG